MPQAHIPVGVESAVEVVEEYLFELRSSKRSVAKPRPSDSWAELSNPARDRVRYYEANEKEIKSRLASLLIG